VTKNERRVRSTIRRFQRVPVMFAERSGLFTMESERSERKNAGQRGNGREMFTGEKRSRRDFYDKHYGVVGTRLRRRPRAGNNTKVFVFVVHYHRHVATCPRRRVSYRLPATFQLADFQFAE